MKAVLLACTLVSALSGQTITLWPEAFRISASAYEDSIEDSAFTFASEQMLYSLTYKGSNAAQLYHENDRTRMRQRIAYDVERDEWLQTGDRLVDLTGAAHYKVGRTVDYFGLEWAPLARYSTRTDSSHFRSITDLGPAIGFRIGQFPLSVRGGASAYVWDNNISEFSDIGKRDWSDTLGIYGGFSMGSPTVPVGADRLYIHGLAYGRAVEGAQKKTALGSILLKEEVGKGDSIYLYVSDTLIDGNGSDFETLSGYVNARRTLENSLRFYAGIRGEQRLGFTPRLYYRYSNFMRKYPSEIEMLRNDVLNSTHTVTAMASGAPLWDIFYHGAIGFNWEKDDKLFGAEIAPGLDSASRALYNQAKAADVRDYARFRAEMLHQAGRDWDNGMGVHYRYLIMRQLRRYPTFYDEVGDTSKDDRDEVHSRHRLSASILPFEKLRLTIDGEYGRNLVYLLRAEKSANSTIDHQYILGARLEATPFESVRFREKVTVRADESSFPFRENEGVFPHYSRAFVSDALIDWRITHSWLMSLQWVCNVWDRGVWDDAKYRDKTLDTLERGSFYAIQHKSIDHTAVIAAVIEFNSDLRVKGGVELNDIYAREYRGASYHPEYSRWMSPFVHMQAALHNQRGRFWDNDIFVDGQVRRYIDKRKDDYWDFNVAFRSMF